MFLCFEFSYVMLWHLQSLINAPWLFLCFATSQPAIKMDYLRVCIISFTEHAYNFEHLIFINIIIIVKQTTNRTK